MSCDKIEIAQVCHVYDHRRRVCSKRIPVWQLPGTEAYFFVSKMAIDVDGAPHAYHPLDKRPPDNHTRALDWLANVSVSDMHGIQGQDGIGPETGFYISGTSLENRAFPLNDTRRYVDAETIPYIVLVNPFPSSSFSPHMQLGDCVIVVDLKSGLSSSAIFADTGRAVGEASLKLAKNLRLDPTASRHPPKVIGDDRLDLLYILFPH